MAGRGELRIVRQAAPQKRLRVDANAAWTPKHSVEMSAFLAEQGVEMIEQPVPANDIAGLRFVRERSTLPVFADESCVVATDVAKLAGAVDKHLPPHHLHQGVSFGTLAVGWLAYILSEADHRKSAVRDWAHGLEHTLPVLLGQSLRPQEFSDDRLGILLNHLADCTWEDLEGDLFLSCFEVYELPGACVRHDSTSSCGYHARTEDGLMQLGHSKDHRPDLPQLKVMAAVTQPLAFPLSTAVVPGNTADDGLYWPSIERVQKLIGKKGLLHVGDNKMAARILFGSGESAGGH